MTTKKRVLGAVAVEMAVLLAVVAFVDATAIRVGLALAAALLLAQRAATATSGAPGGAGSDLPDRRHDHAIRDHVTQLLVRIREFYAACHLARSEKLSTGEAMERIQSIEKDLNRLLADVVRASRGEGLPSESDAYLPRLRAALLFQVGVPARARYSSARGTTQPPR